MRWGTDVDAGSDAGAERLLSSAECDIRMLGSAGGTCAALALTPPLPPPLLATAAVAVVAAGTDVDGGGTTFVSDVGVSDAAPALVGPAASWLAAPFAARAAEVSTDAPSPAAPPVPVCSLMVNVPVPDALAIVRTVGPSAAEAAPAAVPVSA